VQFGERRSLGTPHTLGRILERIADALAETGIEVTAYGKEHPEFTAIGRQMVEQWETGRRDSSSVR
jgi:hypothetical protein